MKITHLTQVGVISRHGNDRRMTLMDPDGPRMCMASPTWGVSLRRKRIDAIVPDRAPAMVDRNSNLLERPEGDGSHPAPVGRSVKTTCRRMRPAGNNGSAQRGTPDRRNHTTRRPAVQPLSVEVVEFSPALVPEQKLLLGRKTRSSRTGGVVPSVVAEPSLQTAGGGGGVTFTAVGRFTYRPR